MDSTLLHVSFAAKMNVHRNEGSKTYKVSIGELRRGPGKCLEGVLALNCDNDNGFVVNADVGVALGCIHRSMCNSLYNHSQIH